MFIKDARRRPRLCALQVPIPLLSLIKTGDAQTLAGGDGYKRSVTNIPLSITRNPRLDVPPAIATDNPIILSYDSFLFATAAFDLRGNIPMNDGETMTSKADVLHWLDYMASSEGFGICRMKQNVVGRKAYQFE